MVVAQPRDDALVRGIGGKAGRAAHCRTSEFSMIARLNRIGERCRSALRAARLLTHVLFVAFRGLYKSWHGHDPSALPAFRRATHAAYRQLWAKLENVYWKLRESNSDASALRALLRDVNAFLAENVLYIREADQELLTQYILSLQRLRRATHHANENDSAALWGGIGESTLSTPANIDGVTRKAVDLRNRVLMRIRQALPVD
jgi:hypothetical protein